MSKRGASPESAGPRKRQTLGSLTPNKTWNGVIYRPTIKGRNEDEMKKDLFTPVETQSHAEKKLIGNRDGMSLLERLDSLEAGHNLLQNSHNLLQTSHNLLQTSHDLLEKRIVPLRTIRTQILNDWADYDEGSKELKNVRNAAAHGGNILEDYLCIKDMEEPNPERAAAWKHAFSRKYQVQYSSCNLIQTWPKEVFEIHNIVVDVRELDRWALRQKEGDEVINLCKRFLRLYRFGEDKGFLNEESQSLQLLRDIREMYSR